jgi:hypothetical protein
MACGQARGCKSLNINELAKKPDLQISRRKLAPETFALLESVSLGCRGKGSDYLHFIPLMI